MTLEQLRRDVHGLRLQGDPQLECARAVADSREVRDGDLFVAIRGERTDGHLFVADAVRAGAAAVLVEREVELPGKTAVLLVDSAPAALLRLATARMHAFRGPVLAVTGSVGKTTTKELLACAVAPLGRVFKNPGNRNSDIGLPLSLLGLGPEHDLAVLELGMRQRGEIRRLARAVRPRVGVITRIGASHVGLLGSLEGIARAKAELLAELPTSGTAVLNADDPWAEYLLQSAPAQVLWAGRSPRADVRLEQVRFLGARGTAMRVRFGDECCEMRLPLLGDGAATDAVLALAAAVAAGVRLSDAARAIVDVRPLDGRLQLRVHDGVEVLDDTYNASPQSAEVALSLLASTPSGGRRIAVLGDMLELGDDALRMHRDLGALAGRSADLVLAMGDFAQEVADAARDAGCPAESAQAQTELVARLRTLLRPGDLVLFKASRGVGLDQVLQALWGA